MAVETRPGSTFAGYLIVGTVGRGGMGVVYRARELALDRPVALKLIAPELASDPAFRERFLEESRIAASLDHASILPVYAAGETGGELYIATRYVEGTDLRRLLAREQALEPERALKLVGQVADALDAAHRRGLVHRDVKPGNVLVDTSDHCYLSDFGLTKELADEGTSASDPLAGSLDYLAPEQIRREAVDGRTDQYALACVLYECLAGSSPFRRETQVETLWAHLHETPSPLADLPALDPVLARALAEDPEQRYPSCSAFVEDAGAALGIGDPLATLRRRRTGMWLVAAGAALLVTALLAVAVAAVGLRESGGDETTRAVSVAKNTVVALDPATNEVVAEIPVGENPTHIAAGDGSIWVVNGDDRTLTSTLTQIDVASRRPVRTFDLDEVVPVEPFSSLAAGLGAAWVITYDTNDRAAPGLRATGALWRVDPSSGRVERTLTLRNPAPVGVAVAAGSVWVGHRRIRRIDPQTRAAVATIAAAGIVVVAGEGAVWAVGGQTVREALSETRVLKIDPSTNSVRTSVSIQSNAGPVAAGEGAVWIGVRTVRLRSVVYRMDPFSGEIAGAFTFGVPVSGMAAGLGSVWVTSAVSGTLSRVDPSSGEIVVLDFGKTQPTGVAVGKGLVWVAVS